MNSDFLIARRGLMAIVAISYVSVFVLAKIVGFKIDYAQIAQFVGYFLIVAVAAHFYCSHRKLGRLAAISDAMACGLLLTAPIVVSTYLAINVKMPLADDVLSSWDVALGVDWRELIKFVDQSPVLAGALGFAYLSFLFQLMIVPAVLAAVGQLLRAYQMLIAYALICFGASFISIWFPALGTYTIYNVVPSDLENINARYGYFFLEQFNAVRENPDFIFQIRNTAGILTFPSVHAAGAALCAWASWSIWSARYPMLLLNVLMAASAVSHANHYVVDVIAGIILAFVCVIFTRRLTSAPPIAEKSHREAIVAA